MITLIHDYLFAFLFCNAAISDGARFGGCAEEVKAPAKLGPVIPPCAAVLAERLIPLAVVVVVAVLCCPRPRAAVVDTTATTGFGSAVNLKVIPRLPTPPPPTPPPPPGVLATNGYAQITKV